MKARFEKAFIMQRTSGELHRGNGENTKNTEGWGARNEPWGQRKWMKAANWVFYVEIIAAITQEKRGGASEEGRGDGGWYSRI